MSRWSQHVGALVVQSLVSACCCYHAHLLQCHWTLLGITVVSHISGLCVAGSDKNAQITCRICETGKYLEKIALPYVFRFLSTELAAMNIKCTLSVQS